MSAAQMGECCGTNTLGVSVGDDEDNDDDKCLNHSCS